MSIRETIIEKTAVEFEKANLALKTLWYIYPCLEDLMSGRDYKLLGEMMLTELGQNYVADMTEDACITQIEDLYPDESQAQLRRRCQIKATAEKTHFSSWSQMNSTATRCLPRFAVLWQ